MFDDWPGLVGWTPHTLLPFRDLPLKEESASISRFATGEHVFQIDDASKCDKEDSIMVKHLYERFLDDEHEYALAEGHWQKLWVEAMRWTGQGKQWKSPWLNTSCVDGSRLRDGDPIFSAWCPKRKRAIRISQHAPREKHVDLYVNVSYFDPDFANIETLEIFCALSVEASTTVYELILSFVTTGEVSRIRSRSPADPCQS